MSKLVEALALISGGLDSILAAKMIKDQRIEVEGICFTTPFTREVGDESGAACRAATMAQKSAEQIGIPLQTVHLGQDYVEMVRNPQHGYGSGLNPCIDCKIFFLKKAWESAQEIGAKFIVTGEVLGQRPMSQNRQALELIEHESGLTGKILRPLSAKFLPETEAEKEGWVVREKLLAIHGRGRKEQIALAEEDGITEYSTPAGGCPLTEKEFSRKLRDLFENQEKVTENDIALLKIGRHFRIGSSKVTVGRNEEENKLLEELKESEDYLFSVQNYPGPTTVLRGLKDQKAIEAAAKLTVRYSDCDQEEVSVRYGKDRPVEEVVVEPPTLAEIENFRVKTL